MAAKSAKRLKSNSLITNGENGENGSGHARVLHSKSVIKALYSESAMAAIWRVAAKALGSSNPPMLYPEYTGEDGATYIYRSLDFWTSGFFPGSLYLLLERLTKYAHHPVISQSFSGQERPHKVQLEYLCRWWTVNLHRGALKRDTHDLGFMIAPWAMKAWSLLHDAESYSSLTMAAHSLASRFNATTQCIRSWDVCVTSRYSFTDTSKDFLVIIDSMLNLDLLFWAARETNNQALYEIAITHARTTRKNHIRPDNSTFHVVNFDADNCGKPKAKFTNQGYSDDSCWTRGQAWGILGFMQTYQWTGEVDFLNTARGLADYFIAHLPIDGVPYWDFAAPVTNDSPRDTSAAMVAACGMLLIYKALRPSSEGDFYLSHAIGLVDATTTKFLHLPTLRFETTPSLNQLLVFSEGSSNEQEDGFDTLSVVDVGKSKSFDTILDGATINNYEFAPRRWANHGLVYADYYFLLFGNMLLEMDLVDRKGYTFQYA